MWVNLFGYIYLLPSLSVGIIDGERIACMMKIREETGWITPARGMT